MPESGYNMYDLTAILQSPLFLELIACLYYFCTFWSQLLILMSGLYKIIESQHFYITPWQHHEVY